MIFLLPTGVLAVDTLKASRNGCVSVQRAQHGRAECVSLMSTSAIKGFFCHRERKALTFCPLAGRVSQRYSHSGQSDLLNHQTGPSRPAVSGFTTAALNNQATLHQKLVQAVNSMEIVPEVPQPQLRFLS